MKQLVMLLFLSVGSVANLLTAQSVYTASTIPAPLLRYAESVVRNEQTTIRIKSAGNAALSSKEIVTVLRKPSEESLDFVLYEDGNTKIKTMRLTLYGANGQLIREYGRSDAHEVGNNASYEFTDNRLSVLSVPVLEPPFTFEYTYEIDFHGRFLFPDWTIQQIGQSVERRELKIYYPPDYQFAWKGVRTDIQAVFNAKEGYSQWQVSQLPAVPSEPSHPFFHGQYAYLVFAPEKFMYGQQTGSMKDWQQFGQFVYDLNHLPNLVSPELVGQVKTLTANCNSEREKIAALYRYLQDNTRYVSVQIGIGGWKSFDASYVEKKRYGDCKALSNFMHTLLEIAGIPSYLALIYGDSDGAPEIHSDIVRPSFNHMILYVPSSDLWLECTSKELPAGYLGEFTSNRTALLLTEQGGRLAQTPRLTETDNRSARTTKVRLLDNGLAELDCSGHLSGVVHEPYRQQLADKSRDEMNRFFTQKSGFQIVQIDKLDFVPDRQSPRMAVDYRLTVPNFAVKSGKRIFINWSKYVVQGRSLPQDTARVMPLYYAQGLSLSDTLVIAQPPGYVVENAPKDVLLETPYDQYRRLVYSEGTERLLVVREVVYYPLNLSPDQYTQVRQFYTDIAQADSRQIVLVKKE